VSVQPTDDRIELSVRFLVGTLGIRHVKDRISRRILQQFLQARIDRLADDRGRTRSRATGPDGRR
jgi:hypothetical protein